MTILRRAAAVFMVMLSGACTPTLPDPVVGTVEPDWGYNGESTEVAVSGQKFYPRVELDAGDVGGILDRQYGLRLEGLSYTGVDVGVALEGVELVSYQQLRGSVPQGIPVGR